MKNKKPNAFKKWVLVWKCETKRIGIEKPEPLQIYTSKKVVDIIDW